MRLSKPLSPWFNCACTALFLTTSVVSQVQAEVGSVSLSWAAPTTRADGTALALSEIAGYTLHYGDSEGDYSNSVAIDDPVTTSITLTDLPVGTYHFALRAQDVVGGESDYSEPVSRQVQNSASPLSGGTITHQMEDGTISGDTRVSTRSSGFTGDGYVRYKRDAGTVEHAVDVPVTGTYELAFTYSLRKGKVAGVVTVDGDLVDPNIVFPTTGSWTTWQTVTTTVELNAGTQPVALSVPGSSINVDSMVITAR
jgi:hypothetical protein